MPSNHKRKHSIRAIVEPTLKAVGAPSATQTSDENSIGDLFVRASRAFAAPGLPLSPITSPTASTPRTPGSLPTIQEAGAADDQENVSSDESTATRPDSRTNLPSTEGLSGRNHLYTTNSAPASWFKRKFSRTDDEWVSSFGTEKGEIIVDGVNLRVWNVKPSSQLCQQWRGLERTLMALIRTKSAELEDKQPPGETGGGLIGCGLQLYLIGSDEEHAVPYVCVLPSARWYGEAVCQLLKESHHLKHPDLECGYFFKEPGAITTAAGDPSSLTGPLSISDVLEQAIFTPQGFHAKVVSGHNESNGTAIEIVQTDVAIGKATIGGVVELGGQLFGMTVWHAFGMTGTPERDRVKNNSMATFEFHPTNSFDLDGHEASLTLVYPTSNDGKSPVQGALITTRQEMPDPADNEERLAEMERRISESLPDYQDRHPSLSDEEAKFTSNSPTARAAPTIQEKMPSLDTMDPTDQRSEWSSSYSGSTSSQSPSIFDHEILETWRQSVLTRPSELDLASASLSLDLLEPKPETSPLSSLVKQLPGNAALKPPGSSLDWALTTFVGAKGNTQFSELSPQAAANKVIIKTSSDLLDAKLESTGLFWIHGRLSPQRVYIAATTAPRMDAGTSGSWGMRLADGKMVGMLIGCCPLMGDLYLLPMEDIVDDIEEHTGLRPNIPCVAATPAELSQMGGWLREDKVSAPLPRYLDGLESPKDKVHSWVWGVKQELWHK
jgi:hypothetical protein